jgi:DNA-binding XRE family transcriptional regulator
MGRDALQHFKQLREQSPELQAEYERLKPRFDLVDQLIGARQKAKLTQKQLGELVGVSQGVIGRLESAEHSPRLETIVDVARALGYRFDVSVVSV